MGFKPYSLIKRLIFKGSLKIKDYGKLPADEKELIDYTIKNDLKLNHKLKLGFRKVGPKQIDFWNLSWNDIILIRHHLSTKDMQNTLELLYGVDSRKFANLNLFNAMAVYKWVVEQIKNINDIEKQELFEEPTQEEKDAGIENLEEFGYAVSLDALSKGNLLDEDDLLDKTYSVIFRKLCLNKVKGEIHRNYSDNASRKNKRSLRKH